jgi:hypothetical protein
MRSVASERRCISRWRAAERVRTSSRVSCWISDRSRSSCSSGSVSRTQISTMWRVGTAGSRPVFIRRRVRHCPAAMATGIPPSMPLNVVSGVLKSPWASTKTIPTRSGFAVGPECCKPLSIPRMELQFARRPTGREPLRRSSATSFASSPFAKARRFHEP